MLREAALTAKIHHHTHRTFAVDTTHEGFETSSCPDSGIHVSNLRNVVADLVPAPLVSGRKAANAIEETGKFTHTLHPLGVMGNKIVNFY